VPKKNGGITMWHNPREQKVKKVLDGIIWVGPEAETVNFFLSLRTKKGESGIFFSSGRGRGTSLEVQEKFKRIRPEVRSLA
jgi:hypothetical protein